VLPVPAFPVLAPELDSTAIHYGDQAVLTEGVVTPFDYMEPPAASPPSPDQVAATLPQAPLPAGPSPAVVPASTPAPDATTPPAAPPAIPDASAPASPST